MANRFEVQVVALDRFTKTFRNLNDQASKAARPLVNIHRQVGALAKELHLDKAAKGIGKVSEAATTLTRTLGLSLGPLDAVLGASGLVGGLLAAGVGAIGLGVRFASTGFEISRTSQRLGVSTSELQRYRGAARLAGVDQDAMTGAIANLGDTLQDAKFGRNPVALQMLNKFGLAIHTNRDGTIDAITTMRELSGVLQGVADPHVQSIIARAFGLEDALPVLRQGPQAVEALAKEAERLGLVAGPQALKWADDFTASLNHMKGAIDGAANSLGAKMLPSLTRVIDTIAKGIDTGGLRGGAAKLLQGVPGIPPIRLLGQVLGIGTGPDPTTPAQRSVSGQITGASLADLGIKRNNPGNLRSWGNAPTSGGFAQFATPGEGLAAMAQQLSLYGDRGINSLSSIINRYAPANENNTGAYVADVSKRTGLAADQKLNLDDRETMASVLAAMVNHEQGRQPFSPDQYAAAAKQAIEIHVHGLPAGATVTARSKTDNAFMPTRISYSFPGDGP